MNGKRMLFIIVFFALLAVLTVTAAKLADGYPDVLSVPLEKNGTQSGEKPPSVTFAEKQDIADVHLRDITSLYEGDDPYDVETMYLTVSYGNASDGTDHTWEEVNTHSAYYYDELGIDRYRVAGLLQVGDENGPIEGALGWGLETPNAVVQVRGQTSSKYSQKNYKIELVDSSEKWRGQRTIALNKHMLDGLRFRNKLIFDLISDVPQMMGLRTQFVHLYVRDTTGENPDVFEDYGLYTQVEQLNKTALKTHGLDKNGYLYKINFFEFYENDEIVNVTDPSYDKKAFEKLLEIKGREEHSRLLAMLRDVNDAYSVSSDQMLDKWFDRENLAYWMAFMMLVGNSDVQSRNLYLYSYLNGQKWYFYPWDNDTSFMERENEILEHSDFSDWQDGVTNYWGNMVFRRALLSSSFRAELTAAIEDLYHNYLQPEKIAQRVQRYAETVLPYAFSMPDVLHEPLTKEEYLEVLAAVPEEIGKNYSRFYESMTSPMPFYVGLPEEENDGIRFVWDDALCFEESEVRYRVWLAKDYEGREILFSQENLVFSTVVYPGELMPGQYFLHVEAENQQGMTTNCFDYYNTVKGSVFGVYSFFVNEDGSYSLYLITEGDN